MTSCSEAVARPVALGELEQLAPPPSQDPVLAAQAIIEAARAEADTLRAQAIADGRAEGMRIGREEVAAELAPAAAALERAAEEAVAVRDAVAEGAEVRAAQLAVAIAEKIVAGALEIEPERVVDVVRGALRGLLDGDRIIVCVHPDDVELVRAAGVGSPEARVEIHGERRVARGGALVRTSVGEIDARIERKLDAVRDLISAEVTGP
ncbi:MAG TPA: FliH/SctL family protein [Solirubrobacteraceae bacterium]|nr:FliH/SctL family protein [Solirubrobacteraceae bacterium]